MYTKRVWKDIVLHITYQYYADDINPFVNLKPDNNYDLCNTIRLVSLS